jgi:hypothetical protein
VLLEELMHVLRQASAAQARIVHVKASRRQPGKLKIP